MESLARSTTRCSPSTLSSKNILFLTVLDNNVVFRFLQEYHKQGVAVWGVTIENEPGAGANKKYKWNSLGFNETVERDFIRLDLGPELHAAGYTADKMKVMIYDDQLPWVKKYAEVVLADHEAAKYISGIAFHWYENNRGKKTDLDDLAKQFADKFILATEACEEWKGHAEHVSLGNWAAFDRYALDIIEDLNHWVAGWTDWNLALDLQGGPNWVGNFVDAPIIVNETEKSYYRQPFFYALAHFSKFLPPESVYVESKVEHSGQHQGRLEAAVFRRPDNATVLIVLNTGDKPTNLHLSHVGQTQFNDIIKAHAMHSFVF